MKEIFGSITAAPSLIEYLLSHGLIIIFNGHKAFSEISSFKWDKSSHIVASKVNQTRLIEKDKISKQHYSSNDKSGNTYTKYNNDGFDLKKCIYHSNYQQDLCIIRSNKFRNKLQLVSTQIFLPQRKKRFSFSLKGKSYMTLEIL